MLRDLNEQFLQFSNGNSIDAYTFLGCHKANDNYTFRVWAPNAKSVSLVGDFNGWNNSTDIMTKNGYGIWETTTQYAKEYDSYKYAITKSDGNVVYKSDPYAFHFETRPSNSSKVYDIENYIWKDKSYYSKHKNEDIYNSPINIYEVHLSSWKIHEDGNPYSYIDLANSLVPYVKEMGYTHIELLPVSEYPYDPSWGYQVTGYYAPTSRFGTPKDFMYFIDKCHENNIGVILDWVGAHFPKDEVGLIEFDGSCLYESSDPVMNEHPDWGTRIFNYERYEVQSFLVSNICYWLDKYHIDGIRCDAVASMLYLDYGRKNGEWHPNKYGSNINLGAIDIIRKFNEAAYKVNPHVMMIAEESTAYPLVTKPAYDGGLGFGFKWNMGWMHDTLQYFSSNPYFRKNNHDQFLFALSYAFSENFILSLSHDEVVYGKCSMVNKMPGEYEEKFENLRALYAYMFAHPGKKLNFMGNEFAQFIEWDFKKQLDWFLLDYDSHRLMKEFSKDLNNLYKNTSELWANDASDKGFKWISGEDKDQNVVSFIRLNKRNEKLIVVCNFAPVERNNYRIGIPKNGTLTPIFCSNDKKYGGKVSNIPNYSTDKIPMHGYNYSVSLTLPPLSVTYYKLKNI